MLLSSLKNFPTVRYAYVACELCRPLTTYNIDFVHNDVMLPFFFILPWPSPTLNLFCEPTVYTFFIPSALYWYTRLARLFLIKPLVELLTKRDLEI